MTHHVAFRRVSFQLSHKIYTDYRAISYQAEVVFILGGVGGGVTLQDGVEGGVRRIGGF